MILFVMGVPSFISFGEECPGIGALTRVDGPGYVYGGAVIGETLVLADNRVGVTTWSQESSGGLTPLGSWERRGARFLSSYKRTQGWMDSRGYFIAATTDGSDGWVFDLRDPAHPKPLWSFANLPYYNPYPHMGAYFRGTTLVIGGRPLVLYDLSDMEHPVAMETSIDHYFSRIVLTSENLVALKVASRAIVMVYRLVQGSEPEFIEMSSAIPVNLPGHLVAGDDLVLVTDDISYYQQAPVVGVIDLKDPDHPVFSDVSHRLKWEWVYDIVIRDRIAYASVYTAGGSFIQMVDFSNAEKPEILTMVEGWGSLILADDQLLVAGSYRVTSWDLGLESSRTLEVFGTAEKMLFDGDLGILADGYGGLAVYDAEDPTHLVELGRIDLGERAWADDVAIADDVAYIAATYGGFVVVDYSVPSSPQLLAQLPLDNARDIALDGNFALVASHPRGSYAYDWLSIFDVSDPANPDHRASIPGFQKSQATCVAAADGIAYLGSGRRVLIIDYHDPDHPRVLSAPFVTGENPHILDLAVSQGLLYSATDQGLRVMDVSDPAEPEIIASVGRFATVVSARGTTAYFRSYDGVSVADFSDLNQPVVRSLSPTRGMWALTPKDDNLFLAAPPFVEVMSLECSAPEAAFEVNISGHFAQFINTSSSWWDEIQWDFGDGESVDGKRDIMHYYEAPGEYDVVLSLSSEHGTSTARQTVNVVDSPAGPLLRNVGVAQ
ncbi:MAG: hypothetical protein K8R59_14975 [Thermoanaerobaculales bacterium]|nr:hypothetical protein [Thermoanaerobaculales bacterium]